MDRRIRRLGIALVTLFGLLFVQLAYVQVFAASRISDNPANASRQIIAEYKVDRGAILTADGQVLAESTPATSKTGSLYRREYQAGPLYAAITGYYSRIYGRSALEQAMNDYLAGSAPELAVSNFTDLILGRPKQGGSVVTTIQSQLQLAAQRALGTLPGAIVAMDPTTGDILAMVANPSFDPNKLSSGTDAQMNAYWDRLGADPATPLVSRAKDRAVPAGVDVQDDHRVGRAAGGLRAEQHLAEPPSARPAAHQQAPGELRQRVVRRRRQHGHDGWRRSRESCNVPWAEIGMKVGADPAAGPGAGVRVLPHRPAHAHHVPGAHGALRHPVPDGTLPHPRLLRAERSAPGLLGDRAGQRAHEPAADGAGGLGDREPGDRDAAAPGDADPRPAGTGGAHVPRRGVRAADLVRQRGFAATDDDQRGGARDRLPARSCRSPRSRARPARPRTDRTRRPTPGSCRSRRRAGAKAPRASPWRLSFWTAATWATRRRVDRWPPLSRRK